MHFCVKYGTRLNIVLVKDFESQKYDSTVMTAVIFFLFASLKKMIAFFMTHLLALIINTLPE